MNKLFIGFLMLGCFSAWALDKSPKVKKYSISDACASFKIIKYQAKPKENLRLKRMTHAKSIEMIKYMQKSSIRIIEECKNIKANKNNKMLLSKIQLRAQSLRPYLLEKEKLSEENKKHFEIITNASTI
jgi:hypothetical protein